jgi:RNA polymerase sigma-70 factor, ECF subfamily
LNATASNARDHKGANRDEGQMIAAILAGDKQVFHELIRPYERTVYMVALGMLKDEAEAEDAAQEAFLKAYSALGRFRSESKFSTWLISIAINESRSRLRRKKSSKTESLDAGWDGDGEDRVSISPAALTDWREIPSEAVERSEVRTLLTSAVGELPPMYREIFMLRDVEELSVNEAAEALGISVALVKVRLHRARMMLQKMLAPQLKSLGKAAVAGASAEAGISTGARKRRFLWF